MHHRSREPAKAAGAAGGRRVQRTHARGRFYNTRETRSLTQQAVEAIYRMNRALGIPECFPCIRPEDLPQMAAWAEANPVYPMPVIFGKEDFIRVARRVMP